MIDRVSVSPTIHDIIEAIEADVDYARKALRNRRIIRARDIARGRFQSSAHSARIAELEAQLSHFEEELALWKEKRAAAQSDDDNGP